MKFSIKVIVIVLGLMMSVQAQAAGVGEVPFNTSSVKDYCNSIRVIVTASFDKEELGERNTSLEEIVKGACLLPLQKPMLHALGGSNHRKEKKQYGIKHLKSIPKNNLNNSWEVQAVIVSPEQDDNGRTTYRYLDVSYDVSSYKGVVDADIYGQAYYNASAFIHELYQKWIESQM